MWFHLLKYKYLHTVWIRFQIAFVTKYFWWQYINAYVCLLYNCLISHIKRTTKRALMDKNKDKMQVDYIFITFCFISVFCMCHILIQVLGYCIQIFFMLCCNMLKKLIMVCLLIYHKYMYIAFVHVVSI